MTIPTALAAAALTLPLAVTPTTGDSTVQCVSVACKYIAHYSPDAGYDPPIKYRCDADPDWVGWLDEGETSGGQGCGDAGAIYVGKGQEIWSKQWSVVGGYEWEKQFDATGWHGLGFGYQDGDGLTVRRD